MSRDRGYELTLVDGDLDADVFRRQVDSVRNSLAGDRQGTRATALLGPAFHPHRGDHQVR